MSQEPKAFSVFNQSTNKEGTIDRCVVIDKNGHPKELIGLDEETQTSIQLFEPMAGDVIVQSNNVEKKLSVTSASKDNEGKTLADLVSKELYDVVNVYLHFEFPDNGFFIIAGVNDTIYGRSMEETFQRREQLADFFKGLNPELTKIFANWIDKANPHNFAELRWDDNVDNINELDGQIQIMQEAEYDIDDKEAPVSQKFFSAIIWYKEANEHGEFAEYVAINHNVKDLIDPTCNSGFSAFKNVRIDDTIEKVVKICQVDDILVSISPFSGDGIPHGAIMKRRAKFVGSVYDNAAKDLDKLLDSYDLKMDWNNTSINSLWFSYDKPFSVTSPKLSFRGSKYSKTLYKNDKGRVFEYDLTKEKPVEEDFYSRPHIHVYSNTDYDGEEYILVNLGEHFKKPV